MLNFTLIGALLAAFAGLADTARAQSAVVSGIVFVDANGNGVRDASERGLANVAVSNQDAVVTTDASGAYRLPRGPNGLLFVSVPDGYRAVGSFWQRVNDAASTVEFALAPVPRVASFTFIHASDTHIAPASLARTQRFRALSDSLNPAFVIITGDLVRDALRVGEAEATGYYDLFAREVALFKNRIWTVPGNHENFGIERGQSHVAATHPLYGREMYHHYRGPDYYSLTFGGVHFVGLNSVDIDDQWYYGHVDSLQLAWLERDLALVPSTMPVVTFNHIPFFSSFDGVGGYRDEPPAPTLIAVKGKTVFRHTVSNAGDVLAVLRKHRVVLALGGHIHASEHIEYEVDGLRTRFNQAAAIVAPTSGAGMQFASGIALYTVRDGVVDAGRFIPLGMEPRWKTENASLPSTPGPLAGTLVLPVADKAVPLAIIVAGSGPTDRNGNSAGMPGGSDAYRQLAESLAVRGIASLRYDKRGLAGSRAAGVSEAQLRFEMLADDAAAWVRLYRADARFTSIVVVGHSEGSLLGMLAVQKSGANGFVSIAGPARRADAILREQLAAQLPPAMLAQCDTILAALVRGDTVASTPPVLAALFRPSVQPYLISWFRYTGSTEIAKLRVPTLIVQGTNDLQVPRAEADLLARAQPSARTVIVDGMNHVLKLTPAGRAEQMSSYSNPEIPLAPKMVAAIADFILALRHA